MNIKPAGKRILVIENKTEAKTNSGIILEGVASGDTKSATVLDVGPDVTVVKPGDVLYTDWKSAIAIKVDGRQQAFIEEDHILGVVVN